MARAPVNFRTPGSRGVWVDRSPARRLSYADKRAGDPPLWAARHGHLLAGHAGASTSAALPILTATDVGMPQVWRCLPEDTNQAFGSRFSQLMVRVLRGLRTSEGTVGRPRRYSTAKARRPICSDKRSSLSASRVHSRYGAITRVRSGNTPSSNGRRPEAGRPRPSTPLTTPKVAPARGPCTGRALRSC